LLTANGNGPGLLVQAGPVVFSCGSSDRRFDSGAVCQGFRGPAVAGRPDQCKRGLRKQATPPHPGGHLAARQAPVPRGEAHALGRRG